MGIIDKLNKDFESRVRLGIMSILMVNEWVDFTEMKTLLNITDGNLASHSAALEKAEYIEIKKEFVGKKPKTSYQVTEKGRQAFKEHLSYLEKLMKS
ncbi:winged helix-turn-helix domain-containing protein [Flavobacterium foetidum]|uniref:winged helix-turn-helix domain-containing protein n=1 Tax=Flavobacterium foetidum TaxID=2026681 RepID=UPI001075145C|nr:transcriptional regulator [Flavobacterium foetidum]KAF2514186.1 transcriptional regulator [Flavobacterium foetidum]